MTLPPPVRAAVLEVAARLRDPMRECHVDSISSMVTGAMRDMRDAGPVKVEAALNALRISLGLPIVHGSLARWARGKSREEVAAALEQVATFEATER
jgi:hypothetical protein